MENTHNKIKVILAEDHLLFADGVEQILGSVPGIEVIAKVSHGKLLMQTLNNQIPDLLLLDINMPFMDGLEAARLIKTRLPNIKIIFLSMYWDSKILAFVKEHNINGFIMKTVMAMDLKEAIQKVINGQTVFLLPEHVHKGEMSYPDDEFGKQFKLSPRETEIIKLIKEGNSTKQISELLFLSAHTVETHRKNIFRKLQVKNVAELIAAVKDAW